MPKLSCYFSYVIDRFCSWTQNLNESTGQNIGVVTLFSISILCLHLKLVRQHRCLQEKMLRDQYFAQQMASPSRESRQVRNDKRSKLSLSSLVTTVVAISFLNVPFPASFPIYFRSFEAQIQLINCEKYPSTMRYWTYRTWVSSHDHQTRLLLFLTLEIHSGWRQ